MSSFEGDAPCPLVSLKEITHVFQLCRSDHWKKVSGLLMKKPWIALYPMTMDNNITTTVLHQAISSRGNIHHRAVVMDNILVSTPEAARLTNGYGSLPLHVIAQRNTKINAQIKERIIYKLIAVYEEALTKEGGPGKRTPLHIIFTDYVSPKLTQFMIEHGSRACFIKDRKGYLPAHVACSRHCSPEKLGMLLAANPAALNATTKDGQTLLSLAINTATKSHPNYALIDELNLLLESSRGSSVTPDESDVLSERPQNSSVTSLHDVLSSNINHVTPNESEIHSHHLSTETRRLNDDVLDVIHVVPNVDPVNLLLRLSHHRLPEQPPSLSLHEHGHFAEV